jgi:hypothetical protein
MKCLSLAIGILVIAASTASFSQTKSSGNHGSEFSNAQIRKLVSHAHTVEEYTVIADYYARRQQFYKGKAAEEMHLWADRSAVITPLSEKWPRPVDSARNLRDYYEYEASRSAKLLAKYSALADTTVAQ